MSHRPVRLRAGEHLAVTLAKRIDVLPFLQRQSAVVTHSDPDGFIESVLHIKGISQMCGRRFGEDPEADQERASCHR